MGVDLNIFTDSVDEELICCICTDVLEDAVQLSPCQHLYCRSCLIKWFDVNTVCPIDNLKVNYKDITAVPRSIQNMLSKLSVRCDRCQQLMCLSKYRIHDCFQEILSQMGDYIAEMDTILTVLEIKRVVKVTESGLKTK